MTQPEPRKSVYAPPSAWILESLRALGYSAATAAADIVDNSVSAGAKKIWLANGMAPNPTDSYVAFADNGSGMSEARLEEAMRAGSRDPRSMLGTGELGRFGLGMKSASLSQGRRLTVWSKSLGSEPSVCQWDLDRIDDWQLFKSPLPIDGQHLAHILELTGLDKLVSGTVVMWSNLDRFLEINATDQAELGLVAEEDLSAEEVMARKVHGMLEHVGQVFHRFLTPQGSEPARLEVSKIFSDGSVYPVAAWDPFLETAGFASGKTQNLPQQRVLRGQRGEATIRPVILPHRTDLPDETWSMLSGHGSLIGLQGFYVYREDRLISIGGWLGLDLSSDDPYKLARIAINLRNTADAQWKVTVDKSSVQIPAAAARLLTTIASAARKHSAEVYRGRPRGPKVPGKSRSDAPVPIWKRHQHESEGRRRTTFQINRAHPMVKEAAKDPRRLAELLNAVEGGVPYAEIRISLGDRDVEIAGVPDIATAKQHLQEAVEILKRSDEKRCQTLLRIAESVEPFSIEEYRAGVSQLTEEWNCRRGKAND